VAWGLLVLHAMKNHNPTGQNQGEGDKLSARHYNRQVREFIAEGKVDSAAEEARRFLEREPDEAERAEQRAKKGPRGGTRVSVDELVAKGRTVFDRVRSAAGRIRSKLSRR
jgi:hypothetical protein